MNNFDDTPIRNPTDDRFGFDPFAHAISDCIRKIPKPVGSVVAIYGSWGSGKSSAINLVRNHLSNDAKDINVINFLAWMYHNEDALVVGFFKELYAGLSPVLSKQKQAATALRKLGNSLVGVENLAAASAGLFGIPFIEKATIFFFSILRCFIKPDTNTEDLQDQLAKALRQEDKRFLIVIDDLDRLSPEEALVIFRLIKSVGRLPNVMYLLAYDRDATEEALKEKFPSEGPHYLEKIVQAGFELPRPDQHRLITMMSGYLDNIASKLPDVDNVEFQDLFHSIVVPELKTPRDVIRLANTLPIVVEPVKNDVFFPDFMSLETLRIFRPGFYQAIRDNKSEIFIPPRSIPHNKRDKFTEKFFLRFLKSERQDEHERLKSVIIKLFPKLQNIFVDISRSRERQWARQRRVCLEEHFDSYFRFALSPQAIPREEIDYLLDSKRNVKEIQKRFIESIDVNQAEDRSKVSYLLEELTAYGETITAPQAERILSALFPIADKIIERNESQEIYCVHNRVRIYSLLRAFLCDRMTIDQVRRSGILLRCMKDASLQWLSDFARSAWIEHHPIDNSKPILPENIKLLTREDAETLREMARCQIEASAIDGTLIDETNLLNVLHAWNVLKADGSDEIHRFTSGAIANNQNIVKLAWAFIEKAYDSDVGIIDRAQTDGIEKILNIDEFRTRLESLATDSSLSKEEKNIIRRLLEAWETRDREGVDFGIPAWHGFCGDICS